MNIGSSPEKQGGKIHHSPKLKLDLHTHCYEATGYGKPTAATATRILEAVRAKGLDGIAVTEHFNDIYGRRIKEIVETSCRSDIIVLPGREIEENFMDIVELYLPDGGVFRFVAHPGFPHRFDEDSLCGLKNIHGIEVHNGGHKWQMDKDAVVSCAEKLGLMLLSNSDAHYLEDIGRFYNEISLDELCSRASGGHRGV